MLLNHFGIIQGVSPGDGSILTSVFCQICRTILTAGTLINC